MGRHLDSIRLYLMLEEDWQIIFDDILQPDFVCHRAASILT